MPGPILPTTDIKILDIADQLVPAVSHLRLYDLYDHASTTSGISPGSSGYAGNFHNLAMGVGTQGNFATKIWAVWNGGSNLRVGNWGNYYYDANVVLDWNIEMAAFKPGDLVGIDLYLSDTNNGSGTNHFVTTISLGSNQSSVETDFDTGIPAFSTFNTTGYYTTGYWIYAEMSSNITGSICSVSIPSGTFGDTDGVGPDTSRTRKTSGMPISIGASGAAFAGVLFGGSAIGSQIAYNKRTYFALEINAF